MNRLTTFSQGGYTLEGIRKGNRRMKAKCAICGKPLEGKQKSCKGDCHKEYVRKYFNSWSKKNRVRCAKEREEKKKEQSHSICPKCRKTHHRENSGPWRFCEACEKQINQTETCEVIEHSTSYFRTLHSEGVRTS